MKTIALFNNKGGVGKTSLVYHLAWMFAEKGIRVLAADLDPQSNLTSMFLEDDKLIELWPDGEHPHTVSGAIQPLIRGVGDIKIPHIEKISDNLGLLVGDLGLSIMEDDFSSQWPECNDGKERAFRVISACYRLLKLASEKNQSEIVFIDIGPNLGPLNRAVLIASDYVVFPIAPDLFSLQGLKNLGPTLRNWRKQWSDRLSKNPNPALVLPQGLMKPVGYIVVQHSVRQDRPVQAYARWANRIPCEYNRSVLDDPTEDTSTFDDDFNCLSHIRHYRSLMPMAMEARKPIFHLKPADGAIGAHTLAVQSCYHDFSILADKIYSRIDMDV